MGLSTHPHTAAVLDLDWTRNTSGEDLAMAKDWNTLHGKGVVMGWERETHVFACSRKWPDAVAALPQAFYGVPFSSRSFPT